MERRQAITTLFALGFSPLLISSYSPNLNLIGHAGKFIILVDTSKHSDPRHLRRLIELVSARHDNWQHEAIIVDVNRQGRAFRGLLQAKQAKANGLSLPAIVRAEEGWQTPGDVELYTLDWLSHVEDGDACYPISSGWGSVEGDWNPRRSKIIRHLDESANHETGKFELDWLKLLNRSELQSAHSDHHREMIEKGEVHWDYVNKECPK